MIVVVASYVHSKLTEFFFLLRFELAFDRLVIELAAHLVEVSVQVQTFNREIQASDGVRYSFVPALERLLDRNELISESQGGDRMPRVNR